jgi:hypothetical protein
MTKKFYNLGTRPRNTSPLHQQQSARHESKSFKARIEKLVSPKPEEPNAEMEAALRSMKTNLLMLLLFMMTGFIFLIPPLEWKMFAAIMFQSFLKLLLPIVTTISNFGPVKEVARIYFENFKERWTSPAELEQQIT